MLHEIMHGVLECMGWFASFVVEITPNNCMFVELATLLAAIWLIAAIILFILTSPRNRGK